VILTVEICPGGGYIKNVGQFRRRLRLEGVTHKALTQALRRLERNGLIAREVLATSPIAVEYSITDLGRTLQVPLGAAFDWAINHLHEIQKAQETYDNKKQGRDPPRLSLPPYMLDQRAELRRKIPPIRKVEVKAREGRATLLEERHQLAG
jgi:DNA-binding HxlR family transcriptional regulator